MKTDKLLFSENYPVLGNLWKQLKMTPKSHVDLHATPSGPEVALTEPIDQQSTSSESSAVPTGEQFKAIVWRVGQPQSQVHKLLDELLALRSQA